jgi:hypothetical protein
MIMAVSVAPSRAPATPKWDVTKAATVEASPADTTWVGGTVLFTTLMWHLGSVTGFYYLYIAYSRLINPWRVNPLTLGSSR